MGIFHDIDYDNTGMGWGYDHGEWSCKESSSPIEGCYIEICASDCTNKKSLVTYYGFREIAERHGEEIAANYSAACERFQKSLDREGKAGCVAAPPAFDMMLFSSRSEKIAAIKIRAANLLDYALDYLENKQPDRVGRLINDPDLSLTSDEVSGIVEECRVRSLEVFASAKVFGYLADGREVREVPKPGSKPELRFLSAPGERTHRVVSIRHNVYASPPDLISDRAFKEKYFLARTGSPVQCINKHVFVSNPSCSDGWTGVHVSGRNWRRTAPVVRLKLDGFSNI